MKKVFIISMLLIISICSIFLFLNKQEEQILIQDNTTLNSSSLAVYLENEDGEYESSSTIPLKDDGYVFSNAVCENDVEVKWNEEAWSIIVSDEPTFRCHLYFNIKVPAKDTILLGKNVATRNNFSTALTTDTTGTIYQAEDNDGKTYYFSGGPTDNWVSFAGFYWRIIRINGDGTIRLIYNGTSTATTGTSTQIGTSKFNDYLDEMRYVGIVYGELNDTRGYGNNSTIITELNNWYQTNILVGEYVNYIDKSASFCSDRNEGTRIETGNFYYAAYDRLNSKSPSFKCDAEDLLSEDNGRLDYSIGLITADEVMYGGLSDFSYDSVENNYLYTNTSYWTMSPAYFGGSNAHVVLVVDYGWYSHTQVIYSNGVRPVINLRADVTLTGSGTSTDPYVVS